MYEHTTRVISHAKIPIDACAMPYILTNMLVWIHGSLRNLQSQIAVPAILQVNEAIMLRLYKTVLQFDSLCILRVRKTGACSLLLSLLWQPHVSVGHSGTHLRFHAHAHVFSLANSKAYTCKCFVVNMLSVACMYMPTSMCLHMYVLQRA
jgi:hypothetical protein